jgi:ABC-type histidine transport system ATPase subunit
LKKFLTGIGVCQELARETDMAMILVTHEMDFARDVADRIVFLHDGQIENKDPLKRSSKILAVRDFKLF